MCMWFGYNPCLNFCYIFHFAKFVIFWPQILWKCCDSGYLLSTTPHTILYLSFWNFAHVFTMVWRCAYGLDIILELIFVTYSTLWTLSFWPQILWRCIDSGYLLSATPYTILHIFFSMVWRCAYDLDYILQLIFVTFPLCHFLQVRHQLHRSSIYIFRIITAISLGVWIVMSFIVYLGIEVHVSLHSILSWACQSEDCSRSVLEKKQDKRI